MAEGPDPKEKGLEDLEQEITCPVCHERFRDPKMLPCLHYYCRECVHQLALRGQPFPCPECRKNTFLPQNDPDQLPTLFFVNRIKDVHAKLEKAQGKVEAMCEMCGGGKAEAFCRQCTYFICASCVQLHPKLKVFAGHEVATLEELKEGGAKRIPVQPAPPPTCKDHEEPTKLFCFDCDRLICRDCIIYDHANHKHEFVKKAAPECKKMLREGLAPLRKINANIAEASKQVEVVKTKLSGQSTSVTNTIRKSFNQLRKILDQREQELLGKTYELVEKKLGTLNAQQKTFQTATAEFLSLSDFVERNLESATDEELMSLHKPILARLEDEGKKHGQLSLEPAEVTSVHIRCADGLTELCRRNAQVSCCPTADPSKCKAEGCGISNADVDKQTQFSVLIVCQHGEPCIETVVVAKLKSLVDGSVVQCAVTENEGGVYEVSYTPKTRGRHSLTVTANGREIAGSPFQVFVKIHPTQLDKPVRTFTGVKGPYGIAFNTEQELLVAEFTGNKVAVLDKQGRRLRTIQCDQFGGPAGVTADKDNNVYVTDCNANTLLKFNKDGKLLKIVGSQGKGPGQFDWPGMIKIIDDQLYVCDRRNHRVQILDLDLQFVGRFGSGGSGKGEFAGSRDTVQDSRGNLYVTDRDNNRVQVFDRDGHFLRAFSEKGSSSEKLNRPVGLCFDSNQFLFVSEFEGKCVSVFKPTGEFVTSFGHMTKLAGIPIDEDGFVFVCDHNIDGISVF